ncbi:Zn(II)2Cys6 transcription factor [Penicillium angulare]|uniref:Zn(II)2Cys6 transcription factor n=1 Tax=Penicillium angulare TaxID=116970 RepID=A0A9W9K538_9EURO|nr:Zn(II)2Cys6 transcription factor [Penicillium angulare]
MAESTCGCALVSVCPQRPGSSLLSIEASYQSLRSFRVADHTTTTDLVSTCEKTLDTGHNDIHLELMGEWKHTLFPEMYKVPESLMGLLSQTIRLANEQELLNRDTIVDFDIPTNLSQRTRLLEHQVLSWDKTHAYPTAPDVNPINEKGFRYDALATHQGLILFYYRRIHNINALILQDTVRKVLDFAQESANAGIENGFPSPLLLWPCFIAACEALEPGLQDRALKFLLDADCQSMAPSFSVAAEVAQKVWSLRRETQDYTIGWVQATAPYRCPIIAI